MEWMVLRVNSFLVGGTSSAWRGGAISRYRVYGSPAVCRWRELIVSKVFWVVTGGPRYPR
jgi:hypothetical protein